MKFTFTVIGKNNEQFISDACNMYIKRISKYYKIDFNIITIKEKSNDVKVVKNKEANQILKAMSNADFNVLLDEKGKSFTSVKFADFIQQKLNLSFKNIQFFVGGAYGFTDEVYKKADYKLTLSSMTFSHQVIRIMFLEQLYRAVSIIHHLPYHNE